MFDHAAGRNTSALLAPPRAAASAAFQIWDAAEPRQRAAWRAAWEMHPEQDVFLDPDYVALYAEPGKVRALCATWSTPGAMVLHPFLLRDLTTEPYWRRERGPLADCVSAYGYAGPAFWGIADLHHAARSFWSHFDQWARCRRVVSEFVRFSLFPDFRLPYVGAVVRKQDNVVRSLDLDEMALWKDFKENARDNISAARKLGVKILRDPTSERLDDFLRIYAHTMDRRQAAASYHFPRTYFERLCAALPGRFQFFHAMHEGRVVSSELVLVSRRKVYSFLGGTDAAYFHLKPNPLLKHELFRWAKQAGKHAVVLGGCPDGLDGILRYKRSFAPSGCIPYHVGERLLLPETAQVLIEARAAYAERYGVAWTPRPAFFPPYRA